MNHELKSHFINLYLIALSDSNFDEKELETIFRIGEEKGISKEEFEKILINPTQVQFEYPSDLLSKIQLLYDFARVIWADHKINPEEEETFLKYGEKLGFNLDETKELFNWLISLAKENIPSSEIENEIQKIAN